MTDHKYAAGDKVRLIGTFGQTIVRGGEIKAMFFVTGCTAVVTAMNLNGMMRIELDGCNTVVEVPPCEVALVSAAPTEAGLEAEWVAAKEREDRAWEESAKANIAAVTAHNLANREKGEKLLAKQRLDAFREANPPAADEMDRRLADKETAQ